jgi:VIT1/CCC1 family predicted Fe2+/Mn2+ transporter
MSATGLSELIPQLQTAVGPVILISGVGLLLLSLTNRFGRAVDRSRQLIRELRESTESDRRDLERQIEILYRRARLIQVSIIFGATSALCAAVLITTLFLAALLAWQAAVALSVLFMLCMLTLIGSLLTFIVEIHLSLRALRLELGDEKPGTAA